MCLSYEFVRCLSFSLHSSYDTCSSYGCFILRTMRLLKNLPEKGYENLRNVWNRLLAVPMVDTRFLSNNMNPLLPNVTWYCGIWPNALTPYIDQALHQLVVFLAEFDLHIFDFCFTKARGFHRTFATSMACQQRALTHTDTWLRHIWDLY